MLDVEITLGGIRTGVRVAGGGGPGSGAAGPGAELGSLAPGAPTDPVAAPVWAGPPADAALPEAASDPAVLDAAGSVADRLELREVVLGVAGGAEPDCAPATAGVVGTVAGVTRGSAGRAAERGCRRTVVRGDATVAVRCDGRAWFASVAPRDRMITSPSSVAVGPAPWGARGGRPRTSAGSRAAAARGESSGAGRECRHAVHATRDTTTAPQMAAHKMAARTIKTTCLPS